MDAIVFDHVPVAELPLAWREKLSGMAQPPGQQVTFALRRKRCSQRCLQQHQQQYQQRPKWRLSLQTIRCLACGATARIWPMWPRMCGAFVSRATTGMARAMSAMNCSRLTPQPTRTTRMLVDLDVLVWLTHGHLKAAQRLQ